MAFKAVLKGAIFRVALIFHKNQSKINKMKVVIIERVLECVSKNTQVPVADILGKSREAKSGVVLARFLVYSILRDVYGLTYTMIGHYLNRKHNTVLSAIQKLQKVGDVEKFIEYRTHIVNQLSNASIITNE